MPLFKGYCTAQAISIVSDENRGRDQSAGAVAAWPSLGSRFKIGWSWIGKPGLPGSAI